MATTAWNLRVVATYAVLLTLFALTSLVDSTPLTYVTAVRCGHTPTSPHYILTIEADALTTDHDLWVDLSYDQFRTENHEHDLSPIDFGPDYELDPDWAARTNWGLTEQSPNTPTNTR
jgi:hypothetical protein